MAVRQLIFDGDELLLKKSRPVEKFDDRLWELLDDMADTMRANNGVGLAAVQVGILRRIFIIELDEKLTEFINPEIVEENSSQTGPEGCLSFPGQWAEVTRPQTVVVSAVDRHGKPFEVEASGLFARAVCHENDHLDGKVYKEIANRILTESEAENYK